MHETFVSIKLALRNLSANQGRVILSVLGIVIGVVAVVLVLSLGMGVKSYVVGQIEAFGTDIIQVEPKVPQVSKNSAKNIQGATSGSVTTFKMADVEALGKMGNISGYYAANMGQAIVSYGGETKQALLYAATAGMFDVDRQIKLADGIVFDDGDDRSLNQVAVLGYEIKNTLFGDENPVGKNLKIKGVNYRVIGYLEERGATGFFNFDELIYIPLKTYQKKIAGLDYVQAAVFKLKDKNLTDATIDEATNVMRREHDISNPDKDDFAVNSIEEITKILDKVFLVINILLIALTSISLIVGGVGIMNVMYVSVVERTAEIGLRKAVGAKKSDILKQFLFEAVFVTIIGGAIGIALGWMITFVATKIASKYGYAISFSVSGYAILLGVGFSVVTGIIFGMYPARKASRLSPMEALRRD